MFKRILSIFGFNKKDENGPKEGDIRNKNHYKTKYIYDVTIKVTFKNGIVDIFEYKDIEDYEYRNAFEIITCEDSVISKQGIYYNREEFFSAFEENKTPSRIIKLYEYEEYEYSFYVKRYSWITEYSAEEIEATPENLEKYPESKVE